MSTLRVNTLQNTNGVEVYTAKAWVRINITSGTPSIAGSGNVSSITDDATGRFYVNFTNALPDTNYIAVCNATPYSNGAPTGAVQVFIANNASSIYEAPSTTGFRIGTLAYTYGAWVDAPTMTVAVFR